MNLYDLVMSPLEKKFLHRVRCQCIPLAKGNVLEIGIGTGANFPYYKPSQITSFTGVDLKLSKQLQCQSLSNCRFKQASINHLPFADHSFDTVVATLVLCSVQHQSHSLSEIKRVLKPGGRYIFIEHILPENKKLAAFFQKINKPWSIVSHGCQLNCQTNQAIARHFSHVKTSSVANGVFYFGIAK